MFRKNKGTKFFAIICLLIGLNSAYGQMINKKRFAPPKYSIQDVLLDYKKLYGKTIELEGYYIGTGLFSKVSAYHILPFLKFTNLDRKSRQSLLKCSIYKCKIRIYGHIDSHHAAFLRVDSVLEANLMVRRKSASNEVSYQKALEIDSLDFSVLRDYALYQKSFKKDYIKADSLFRKALSVKINDSKIYEYYANFLYLQKRKPEIAEYYYQKAIALYSTSANCYANYAKLLLEKNDLELAKKIIKKAKQHLKPKQKTILAELLLYEYALAKNTSAKPKADLEKLLNSGIRSKGWHLHQIIIRAQENGHPNINKLKELAKQFTTFEW